MKISKSNTGAICGWAAFLEAHRLPDGTISFSCAELHEAPEPQCATVDPHGHCARNGRLACAPARESTN